MGTIVVDWVQNSTYRECLMNAFCSSRAMDMINIAVHTTKPWVQKSVR